MDPFNVVDLNDLSDFDEGIISSDSEEAARSSGSQSTPARLNPVPEADATDNVPQPTHVAINLAENIAAPVVENDADNELQLPGLGQNDPGFDVLMQGFAAGGLPLDATPESRSLKKRKAAERDATDEPIPSQGPSKKKRGARTKGSASGSTSASATSASGASNKRTAEALATTDEPLPSQPSEKKKRTHIACPVCKHLLYSKGNLDRHIKALHSGTPSESCSHCDARFQTRRQLRRHIVVKHHDPEKRSLVCDNCGVRVATKSILNTHTRNMHQPPQIVSCRACRGTFATIRQLRIHLRDMHPDGPHAP